MEALGIGLAGYGMIGKVHTLGYREIPLLYPGTLPPVELAAVCTSRAETARSAAREAGFAWWSTDSAEMVQDPRVTIVDCCLPNDLHRPLLLAAFAAGKHVYCEKPLALNAAEARELAAAAQKAGVRLGLTFNYRFLPALMRARQLIDEGALGAVYSFRAEYLHTGYQNPRRPVGWRMRKERAGGGALVDLGSHAIDLVRHLLGEFDSVRATTRTYIPSRPIEQGSAAMMAVDVDDAAWVEVRLQSGACGTLEVSRFSTGCPDDLNLEVYGEKGALRFSLLQANWLYWFDATRRAAPLGGEAGWTRLETLQHYPGAAVPPPRCFPGWTRTHTESQYAFLRAVYTGREPRPGLADGLSVQLILEAAYRSAEQGGWQQVERQ